MHAALAGVPGIKVAAPAAPGVIAGEGAPDVGALGRKLGVATVLDASIRREGTRVRVSARLSDTQTGYILWTQLRSRAVGCVRRAERDRRRGGARAAGRHPRAAGAACHAAEIGRAACRGRGWQDV